MRDSRSRRAVPLGLAAGAYALALLQRPGRATSDTKIDLHVDPGGFLGRVADVWSPTAGLGHVQGGQYGGYLWPMGPFFSVLHSLGLSPWLVQRLWLGTLLALAAWGAVRLLDALRSPRRGIAHAVAGVVYAVNPYVVVFSDRTTFTLIGYAALPWLLLLVHRGVRDPRRLRCAAAFGLILTSVGGGVNAAVLGWLLVGPLLLLVYEGAAGGVRWRAVGGFGTRAAVAAALASVWWVMPVLVQALYGLNFLSFTEQIGSIWNTTSLPESLRLMGYWPSYLGVGYGDVLRPYFGTSPDLLFAAPVVVAGLLLPGLAVGGYLWTRRWRYGPFFLLLALVGALIMSAGFPNGTPLREGATFVYNRVEPVDFLRTTYKAGPLVAIGLACLLAVAAAELWRRLPSPAVRVAVGVGAAAVVVLASLPMFEGRAVELTWKRIPRAWKDTARGLDRDLPAGSRAIVLPGQPFAFYRWGGTVDPILPSLTDRPVAVRNVPPYDDLHAVDMLWTTDNLLQQERLVPGQLAPLLDLMSARAVVSATDDDSARSGALPPALAASQLADLGRPARSYGPLRRYGRLALPQVRRYDVRARPIVRLEPVAPAAVVDGSARGLADAVALRDVRPGGPIVYAGDVTRARVRAEARRGASVIVTDSNRRRTFLASRPRASTSWTLPAVVPFPDDSAVLDPFEDRGSAAETVAAYTGARYVNAPFSPQIAQFAEHRPFSAFDDDASTSWLPDPTLDDPRHWVEVGFLTPREVPYVDVLPDNSNPEVTVTRVSVNGREFDVHPGWNRLPLRARDAHTLRVAIVGHHTTGEEAGGVGGLREVRVPGLHVAERLRPPVLAERALRGMDLSRNELRYALERTTADEPFRRADVAEPTPPSGNRVEAEAALQRAARDPEATIDRVLTPPVSRTWRGEAWASVAPGASDDALDRLAGTRTGGARFRSSARFEGRPGRRASSAFDGSAETAWAAPWRRGAAAWIEWESARPATVRRLVLERAGGGLRAPAKVSISWPGGRSPALAVGAGGGVELPRAVRARRFRVDVLAAGAGSLDAVGVSELRVAGGRSPRARPAPEDGMVRTRCGVLSARVTRVGGAPLGAIGFTPAATVGQLDAGGPIRMRSCGRGLVLPAAPVELRAESALLPPYLLGLRSPPSAGAARPVASGGRVRSQGHQGRGDYTRVRVAPAGPSWLVLGESYNRGWRAECNGRSLGAPQVVDGFANGWRVGPGCRRVAFRFAPQRAVDAGYWIGGLACLVLVALLVLRWPRRPSAAARVDEPDDLPVDDAQHAWPLRRAAAAGLAAGAVLGFAFALRADVAIAPAVALILWRGWPSRALILAAGALLTIVVPILYVLFPGTDRGGYDTEYAVEHLGAHWVAVAAVVLLVVALVRSGASRSVAGRPARAGSEPGAESVRQ